MPYLGRMTENDRDGIPTFTIGDRLRKARETTGLDQATFAAEIGVSRQTVSNAETEHVRPLHITLLAWAARTGVPLAWLETGELPARPGHPGHPGRRGLIDSRPRARQAVA